MLNTGIAPLLDTQRDTLAEAILARQYARQPELAARYGVNGRAKCLQDVRYHLSFLAEAVAVAHPLLFADYIAWAKVLLAGVHVPAADLAVNLEIMRAVLNEVSPKEVRAAVDEAIAAGLSRLPQASSVVPTFIEEQQPLADLAGCYLTALLRVRPFSSSP
jgi:MerR family transcriptional regulator, light-induced transcriptional regulator